MTSDSPDESRDAPAGDPAARDQAGHDPQGADHGTGQAAEAIDPAALEAQARAQEDVSQMYSIEEIMAAGASRRAARAFEAPAADSTGQDSSAGEVPSGQASADAPLETPRTDRPARPSTAPPEPEHLPRVPGDHGVAVPGRWVPDRGGEGAPVAPLLILTGMSGAGRSTSANVLEDLGWYVVDNLPPRMLMALADLQTDVDRGAGEEPLKVAAIVDVRSGRYFDELRASVDQLRDRGRRPTIVFLDATDEALVRRFESVRRPHPLQGRGRLLDGIRRERESLRNLRSDADLVIDSSGFNVHQLSAKITSLFDAGAASGHAPLMRMAVMSFGFKYGIPLDADFVFDMRWLPNPFWVPELRPHNGREEPVREFVMQQEGAADFLARMESTFEPIVAGYRREGRRYVTIAVGCTGGKHRSVAMAEAFVERLMSRGVEAFPVHRDLGRE